MRGGQLRHRLVLQEKSSTSDGMGGWAVTWTDSREVFGAIYPLRGQEYLQAQQMGSDVTHRIRIRHVDDVTPAYRIRLGDSTRYFDIKSVLNPEERNIQLDIMCKEQA